MSSAAPPSTAAKFALGLALALGVLSGCAPTRPPVVTSPRFPDYPFPDVPAELANARLTERHTQAWQFLQAGDLRDAERRFSAALRDNPGFYPAEAGLAYVELARQDYGAAVASFGSVLSTAPRYVPALVGRGEALMASAREADALRDFEAALTADPALADVRRRVELLRFRAIQDAITTARTAAQAGRFDEARVAFARAIAASPESPTLHRELATIEQQAGDFVSAFAHASRAAELDAFDARTAALLADLHETQGDLVAAEQAWTRAYELDPTDEARRRLDDLRARLRLSRLPPEYGAISGRGQITRGELAAIVGVRLENLLESATAQPSAVVTDTRQHWAASWILAVLRAGVMEAYPNHTFQPEATMRRGDLAAVVSRLLALVASRAPEMAAAWQQGRRAFADVGPGHLSYPAASLAVEAGVLTALEGETFQLARPVSGAEALAAIDRIDALVARAMQQ